MTACRRDGGGGFVSTVDGERSDVVRHPIAADRAQRAKGRDDGRTPQVSGAFDDNERTV